MFAKVGWFAVMLFQRRLVVEQVDGAGGSAHEQLHNALRLGRPMQDLDGPAAAGFCRSGQQTLIVQQPDQSQAAKPAAKLLEKLSSAGFHAVMCLACT